MDSNRNRLYYVGRVGFNVRGEREIARKGNENENERGEMEELVEY